MAVNFVLRTKRTDNKLAPLSVLIRDRKHGINCLVRTPIMVSPDCYPTAKSSKQAQNTYWSSQEGERVSKECNTARTQILTAIADGVSTSEGFGEYITAALVVAEGHAVNADAKRKEKSKIIPYFDWYIDRVNKNKINKHNGEPYSKTCKQQYKNCRNSLALFIGEDSNLTFDDIDIEFYENWLASMRSHYLSNSTINVYFSYARMVCERAIKEKITSNAMAPHVFQNVSGDEKYRQKLLTLSSEEMEALLAMKLDGKAKMVRDVFAVGYEIGQRWSDYGDIDKSQFFYEDGILYFKTTQVKTGKDVVVPIPDQKIIAILKEYSYNMPRINRYTFENYLKKIFAELAKTVDSLKEEVWSVQTAAQKQLEASWKAIKSRQKKGKKFSSTSENIVYNKAKRLAILHFGSDDTDKLWKRDKQGHICRFRYELASSHVARRSRITDMLYQGYSKDDVAVVSGHTCERNLNKYDKRVEEVKARLLAQKMRRKQAGENITELQVAM